MPRSIMKELLDMPIMPVPIRGKDDKPLALGSLEILDEQGNAASIYQDEEMCVFSPNPVDLDYWGVCPSFYVEGLVTIIAKNSKGCTEWEMTSWPT